MLTVLQLLGAAYLVGWLFFGIVTLRTIDAEEVRRHPGAAAITAVLCGLLWPVLAYKDVTGKTPR